MANGRVLIGFSYPMVALYSAANQVATYTGLIPLARGVSNTLSPETSDENVFRADNMNAESVGGILTGGTVSPTVDGLKEAAKRLIFGLPEASTIQVGGEDVQELQYGEAAKPPYVGYGFVEMYQEEGVISYVGRVFTKVKFHYSDETANTLAEDIEWQTRELTADLFRDDTAAHNWQRESFPLDTEEAAVAYVQTVLGGAA